MINNSYFMKKMILFSFVLILFITSGAQVKNDTVVAGRKGMFVLPGAVAFNLLNGQSDTRKLTVINRLDTKSQFRVYVGDWRRDSIGGHEYFPPGSQSYSCAKWIAVDKELFDLEKDSSTVLTVRLQVPDSLEAIKEMKWAMVFVQLVAENKPIEQTREVLNQVTYNFRVGVHVYQTPSTLKHVMLKMESFKPLIVMKDSMVYKISCVNMGEQQLRVKSDLEVTNLTTGEVTKSVTKEFPMFPGQRRVVYFQLPKGLAPGKYSLLATADGGEDMPLEAAVLEVDIN
jgi:hypothetical protein